MRMKNQHRVAERVKLTIYPVILGPVADKQKILSLIFHGHAAPGRDASILAVIGHGAGPDRPPIIDYHHRIGKLYQSALAIPGSPVAVKIRLPMTEMNIPDKINNFPVASGSEKTIGMYQL